MLFLPVASENPERFVPLLIVLGLAFIIPIVLSRFRSLPVVVGEILAGIVIGVSGLQLVEHSTVLDFMSDIGLAFLMFIAGMEIDFEQIIPQKRDGKRVFGGPNVLAYAFGIYLLTFGLAYVSSLLLARLGFSGDPLLLTFTLSATSLGVLLPVLKARDMLRAFSGRLIFVTAMLADFITVIAFTIYTLTYDTGFNVEIMSLGLLFVAFLLFARFGPRVFGMPRVRALVEELSQTTVQIKIRGAMAILLVFVVMAEFLNAELILGAFLAGMVISLVKTPADNDLVHQLEAFGFGFFIPVFFIMVGAGLDLRAIAAQPQALWLLPVFLLLSVVVKVLPMALARPHLSWREVLGAGVLLDTHLSLEVAIAVIGLRLGLLDQAANTTIILFATLTVLIMPLWFGSILPHRPQVRVRRKVLVGDSELALKTAQELTAHGDQVVFLALPEAPLPENFPFPVKRLEKMEDLPQHLPLETVEAILLLADQERVNRQAAAAARALGVENVIALIHNPADLPEYQQMGVQVYSPALQRATMLTMMARSPDALNLLTSSSNAFDVAEVVIRNPDLTGLQVRDLRLPGGALLLALRRDGEHRIPRGNTTLQVGDHLTIFAHRDILQPLRLWLEGQGPPPDWHAAPV